VLRQRVPGDSQRQDAARPPGRRRRRIITAAVILIAAFAVGTGRLFVWPASGMPARVDAVVMLNGPGDRLPTALRLGWEHRAKFLVISRGSQVYGHGNSCAPQIPGVRIICFDPNPSTTRGEAEFAGRLAARYHWRSIALVAIRPQDTRARIRLGRCFGGKVYVVTAPIRAHMWPYEIAYEWGATINALVFQRSC